MKRWTMLPIALLFGCGDLNSGANLGDPIYVMKAEMEGQEAIKPPEGEHRAIFGWSSFGEGEYYDCLEETNVLLCGQRTGQEVKLALFHTEVEPRFPSGFDIPFFAFPRRDDLLRRGESVLAMGAVAIYDDRNLNGELDPIAADDPEPVDKVVAESIFNALQNQDYPWVVALFREGPVHPIWNALRDLYDCPPPLPGYSIGRLEHTGSSFECTVSRTDSLRVQASTTDATARARCGGGVGADLNNVGRSAEPLMPPPSNAVVRCGAANSLHYYEDYGNYCDQFNEVTLRLKGCPAPVTVGNCWDYTMNPPEWWSCPINN